MRSGDRPGRVIFLNGTSSAGKTTLARAIQDESDTPFVYWGIDTLFSLVPPNWGGGRDGPAQPRRLLVRPHRRRHGRAPVGDRPLRRSGTPDAAVRPDRSRRVRPRG
ncbi:hypothetical protein GCM10027199_61630 [Amycolatopsis magusensis]